MPCSRNLYDPQRMAGLGFEYHSVGRGTWPSYEIIRTDASSEEMNSRMTSTLAASRVSISWTEQLPRRQDDEGGSRRGEASHRRNGHQLPFAVSGEGQTCLDVGPFELGKLV